MRLDRLDLNLLVALDALLTSRSVSESAKLLHLSQPAMSSALARLREHFGDPLLVSLGRSMVPTERALALQGPIREILVRIRDAVGPSFTFDPSRTERCFKLVVSDHFLVAFSQRLLSHCAKHAPNITFVFRPFDPTLSLGLERGEVDLVILPDIYQHRAHPSERLLKDRLVCIGWQQEAPQKLTMKRFFDASHVVKAIIHESFLPFDEWAIRRLGRTRNVAAVVPHYSNLPHAIVGTPHLALIQRELARLYSKWLPLRISNIPFECPELDIHMQWNVVQNNDVGLAWLRSTLKELVK